MSWDKVRTSEFCLILEAEAHFEMLEITPPPKQNNRMSFFMCAVFKPDLLSTKTAKHLLFCFPFLILPHFTFSVFFPFNFSPPPQKKTKKKKPQRLQFA